jgi:hypothetical protein
MQEYEADAAFKKRKSQIGKSIRNIKKINKK